MNDIQYKIQKARLIESREFIAENEDTILDAAVERDEAYVLHAWYYHSLYKWPFLTLEEAVARGEDDCVPERIVGPGGVQYDRDGNRDI